MATGFNYPPRSPTRRHGPQGYASYDSFRPWLRDEFAFCCVYCLIREQWGRITGDFHLDHYVPQLIDPRGAAEYGNLLYSCAACNLSKGGRTTPDPIIALIAEQVFVDDDGAISGLTEDAVRLIRVLDLDDEEHRQWRRLWIRIIDLADRYDLQLQEQLLGFPSDLPDLSALRGPDQQDGRRSPSSFGDRQRLARRYGIWEKQ